jgi:hypothetical protein
MDQKAANRTVILQILAVLLSLFLTVTAFAENTANDEDFMSRFRANYVTTFYNTDSGGFPSNDANINTPESRLREIRPGVIVPKRLRDVFYAVVAAKKHIVKHKYRTVSRFIRIVG